MASFRPRGALSSYDAAQLLDEIHALQGVPGYEPGRAYQWGTLVLPTHRGHLLGLATKVENLRRVQAAEPGRSALYTLNSEVNRHMVAVNEALGFLPVGLLGEFVRKL